MTVSCREIVVAVVFIGKTRETCREIVAVVVFKKQRQTEGNKERTDKEEKEKRTKKQASFVYVARFILVGFTAHQENI